MHPQPESYWGHVNPLGIRACYDEGKRAAETLFFDYHRQHKVRIKVARIFNTYGPRMHPNRRPGGVELHRAGAAKPDISIYGDGSQTRSFCYVTDLLDGITKLMNSPEDFIGPVNLGNPCEFSVRQLAEMVIELTDSKSKLIFLPLPSDDPRQRQPDITLARGALSWEPKVALQDGLKETIGYFRNLLAS